MALTIHTTFLPQTDPEATIAFYRDALGFEVRNDVAKGDLHWITVGPPGQPEVSIVLEPPAMDPTLSDDERRTISELIAKGSYARLILGADDLDATFEAVQATGAEVIQEPTSQPWGARDAAFRDPSGNHIRINQL